MTCFLSGEMKDTVQLNPAGAYGVLISDLDTLSHRQCFLQCWNASSLAENARTFSAAGQAAQAYGSKYAHCTVAQ